MREVIDGSDWMRSMERRLREETRRPLVRTAADLLGVGFGPTAAQVLDWNDDGAALNGFYHSAPGAINGPDPAVAWIGTSFTTAEGFGVQRVTTLGSSPVVMTRSFSPTAGARIYTPWLPERWSDEAEQSAPVTVGASEVTLPDLALGAPVPSVTAIFAVHASLDWRRLSNDTPLPIMEARLRVNGSLHGTTLKWASNTVDNEITVSKRWRVTGLPAGNATFALSAMGTSAGNYSLRAGTLLVERLA